MQRGGRLALAVRLCLVLLAAASTVTHALVAVNAWARAPAAADPAAPAPAAIAGAAYEVPQPLGGDLPLATPPVADTDRQELRQLPVPDLSPVVSSAADAAGQQLAQPPVAPVAADAARQELPQPSVPDPRSVVSAAADVAVPGLPHLEAPSPQPLVAMEPLGEQQQEPEVEQPPPPLPPQLEMGVPPEWSLAAAPAPAPALPASVLEQARERLKHDHHSIANASEELLQVQNEVSNMESQLFGKVVGSDHVEDLLVRHEATEAENARLVDDIQRLTEQIGGLSLQLAQMQRGYVAKGKQYRAHERQLRGEVAQSEATAEGLDVELTKGRKVDEVKAALSEARAKLTAEGHRIASDGHTALRELQEVQKAAAAEEGKHAALQQELLKLHSMGVACNTKVNEEKKEVRQKKATMPAVRAAAAKASDNALAVAHAAEQRVAAEGIILRGEVHEAEKDGLHALAGLQDVQSRLKGLEFSLVAEVRDLNGRINATKGQIHTVIGSLQVNTGVSLEDQQRKHEVQVKLSTVQREVSPVSYASLSAENDVYAVELDNLLVNVTAAKNAEAAAFIGAQQVESQLHAQHIIEKENREALEEAEQTSKDSINQAVKETSEKVAASQALEAQAKDALAAKCSEKWTGRKEDQDKALATCASQRAQLAVLKAQEESLKSTLESQNAAASPAA